MGKKMFKVNNKDTRAASVFVDLTHLLLPLKEVS